MLIMIVWVFSPMETLLFRRVFSNIFVASLNNTEESQLSLHVRDFLKLLTGQTLLILGTDLPKQHRRGNICVASMGLNVKELHSPSASDVFNLYNKCAANMSTNLKQVEEPQYVCVQLSQQCCLFEICGSHRSQVVSQKTWFCSDNNLFFVSFTNVFAN